MVQDRLDAILADGRSVSGRAAPSKWTRMCRVYRRKVWSVEETAPAASDSTRSGEVLYLILDCRSPPSTGSSPLSSCVVIPEKTATGVEYRTMVTNSTPDILGDVHSTPGDTPAEHMMSRLSNIWLPRFSVVAEGHEYSLGDFIVRCGTLRTTALPNGPGRDIPGCLVEVCYLVELSSNQAECARQLCAEFASIILKPHAFAETDIQIPTNATRSHRGLRFDHDSIAFASLIHSQPFAILMHAYAIIILLILVGDLRLLAAAMSSILVDMQHFFSVSSMSALQQRQDAILTAHHTSLSILRALNNTLAHINRTHIPAITDQAREVERRFAPVYVLFETAVFAFTRTREGVEGVRRGMNGAAGEYAYPRSTNRPSFV